MRCTRTRRQEERERRNRRVVDVHVAVPVEIEMRVVTVCGDRALQGIDLGQTSLFIRSGASALPFAALLMALAQKRRLRPANLRGCIEALLGAGIYRRSSRAGPGYR